MCVFLTYFVLASNKVKAASVEEAKAEKKAWTIRAADKQRQYTQLGRTVLLK